MLFVFVVVIILLLFSPFFPHSSTPNNWKTDPEQFWEYFCGKDRQLHIFLNPYQYALGFGEEDHLVALVRSIKPTWPASPFFASPICAHWYVRHLTPFLSHALILRTVNWRRHRLPATCNKLFYALAKAKGEPQSTRLFIVCRVISHLLPRGSNQKTEPTSCSSPTANSHHRAVRDVCHVSPLAVATGQQ